MTQRSLFLRGQITVFILLLGLLGLTIGMSAASRSLSDLKQATYTETGTKALAGAEAGLQYGLSQLNANAGPTPRTDCDTNTTDATYTDVTSNIALPGFLATRGIKYRICMQLQPYFSDTVTADDVMEIDVSKVDLAVVKKYRIAWGNTAAAIEVAYLDSNFVMNRYAFNGPTPANNFDAAITATNACGTSSRYQDIPAGVGGLLLRVKPMFGTTNIYVCGLKADSTLADMSAQYYTTEVIATTTGGTVKRLSSKKTANGLPPAFDNALFSAGDIVQN